MTNGLIKELLKIFLSHQTSNNVQNILKLLLNLNYGSITVGILEQTQRKHNPSTHAASASCKMKGGIDIFIFELFSRRFQLFSPVTR